MSSDYSPRRLGGIQTGITADTGSAQDATADQSEGGLGSYGINVISTVGTAGDAVTLPANVAKYSSVVVVNTSATSADVFPNVGATINGGSANAALALAAGAGREYIQIGSDGLTWIAL